MARTKAVVLLSGGLDSAFNLWQAPRDYDVVRALTFDYGQRAAQSEISTAKKLCARLKVSHQVIELPWFRDFTHTSLVNTKENVPVGHQVSIDQLAESQETAKAVWVPNRNGIFLNIAAAYAEGLGAQVVLTGFNAEEAVTFPDNSIPYLESLNHAFSFSTANQVRVQSYCANLSKTQIVAEARHIGLPLDMVWPCYFSGDEWCGQCESCQRFARAVRAASISAGADSEITNEGFI
ncbi:MAG: 7-cyano-7-deazaguanine synthase QueC [Bdellovibrionales bacterium]